MSQHQSVTVSTIALILIRTMFHSITSENREKNSSRENARVIFSLDEVMIKILRGCVIQGDYGRGRTKTVKAHNNEQLEQPLKQ